MPYTPNQWVDGDKSRPLSAARLAHMEGQYAAAMADVPGAVLQEITEDGPVKDQLSATIDQAIEDAGIPQGAVTSFDISSISVTLDPNDEPALGELLLVFPPPPSFFADFATLPVASGIPAGWSQSWAQTAGTWATVDDGGKTILRHTHTGTGRRLLAWNALDAASKGDPTEIVWKWRADKTAANGAAPRAALRASGAASTETGIAAGQQSNGTTGAFRYLAGASTTISGAGTTPKPGLGQANVWYITRLRVDGTQLRVKTWLASDPEPNEWDWEPVDSGAPTESGKAGLLPFGSGASDYAWFGVAYRGGTAPMVPVS